MRKSELVDVARTDRPAIGPEELADSRHSESASRSESLGELSRRVEALNRELEQSRARFRDIIERNADAIVVVDRDGVIQFANEVAARLFATTREDLVGSAFGFPVVGGETTELDLPSNPAPRVAEMRVVESEWEGELAYIASLRDITERKEAEESARRLLQEEAARAAAEKIAERFRFLADCSTVFSSSLDSDTILSTLARSCVSVLADWAAVYAVDESGRLKRLDLVHRDPAKAHVARRLQDLPLDRGAANLIAEVMKAREPRLVKDVTDQQLRSLVSDDRRLEMFRELGLASLIIAPMVARDRELGAIALALADGMRRFDSEDFALAVDLASRAALAVDNARSYQEARHANQMKSDFLGVISHDLRTPLNAIIGYADLLDQGIPEKLTEPSREQVQRIRVSANHLLYLINELLAFARLDSGREDLAIQPVDVRDVARDIVAMTESLAAERGLRLHLDLPPDCAAIQTDPDKLRQVLLNLVENAVKYTAEGEIGLLVRANPGGSVEVVVRDTGAGIAAEHLDHIFDPFWQADPTQRMRGGGTGLGLSVVRRLVRLLGGEVSVQSTLGEGSTFTVALPTEPPVLS